MGVLFTNQWVEEAVRKILRIPEGTELPETDLKQIKYLRIGAGQDADFIIELSVQTPPAPFADTDGGDEWYCCLRGEDIKRFLEEEKKVLLRPFLFGFQHERNKDAVSDEAEKAWRGYRESIVKGGYFEESSGTEAYAAREEAFEQIRKNLYKDILLFSGVEVLRITGISMPDYAVFHGMSELKTLELVEVGFGSIGGYEKLSGLQQLSCWLD